MAALIYAHDQRTVGFVASVVMWASGILTALQAWLANTNPLVLYLLAAIDSAGLAVVSPARSAIYPRLLEGHLLPAGDAVGVLAFNVALTVGPLMAGFLLDWGGYQLAYSVDVALFTSALWGLFRLPSIPPQPHHEALAGRRAGLASVLDGLRFLRTRPNIGMTFLSDMCAMILAMPRALLPAVAALGVLFLAAPVPPTRSVQSFGPRSFSRPRLTTCADGCRGCSPWSSPGRAAPGRLRGGVGRDGIQRGRCCLPGRHRRRRHQRMAAGLPTV